MSAAYGRYARTSRSLELWIGLSGVYVLVKVNVYLNKLNVKYKGLHRLAVLSHLVEASGTKGIAKSSIGPQIV